MKFLKFILIFSLFYTIALSASANQKITLKDKSVVYGKIISMANGVYTIKTDSFGTIKLGSDKIISITDEKAISRRTNIKVSDRPTRTRKKSYNRGVESYPQSAVNAKVKNKMTNGKFVNQILDLSDSSSLTDVMSDPEVMDAINNNDYNFLMNNDKMNKLMNSPEIKELLGNFE